MRTIETEKIMVDGTHVVGFVYLVEDASHRRWVEIDIIDAKLDHEIAAFLGKLISDFSNRAKLWNSTL